MRPGDMHMDMLIKTKTRFYFTSNTWHVSGNVVAYEINNDDIKSKSDKGDVSADRMATSKWTQMI